MNDVKTVRIKIVSIIVSFLLLMPIIVISAVDGNSVEDYADAVQTVDVTSVTEAATTEKVSEVEMTAETTTAQETTTEVTTEETTAEIDEVEAYEEVTEPTVKKEAPAKVNNSYSDDDLTILSHLIYGEAGGESDECQLAVGSVVLNRVKSKSFPYTNTIQSVVFAPGQYACTTDGNYDKTPDARAIKNARYLLEHGSQLPDGVVYQAQFVQGEIYAVIDGEYFCYG